MTHQVAKLRERLGALIRGEYQTMIQTCAWETSESLQAEPRFSAKQELQSCFRAGLHGGLRPASYVPYGVAVSISPTRRV